MTRKSLSIVLFTFLTGALGGQALAQSYPAEFRDAFLLECVPGAGDAICNCVLHKLETTVPYAQVLANPDDIELYTNLTYECIAEVGTAGIPLPGGTPTPTPTPTPALGGTTEFDIMSTTIQQLISTDVSLLTALCDPMGGITVMQTLDGIQQSQQLVGFMQPMPEATLAALTAIAGEMGGNPGGWGVDAVAQAVTYTGLSGYWSVNFGFSNGASGLTISNITVANETP